MSSVAEVKLWGRTIGAVALEQDASIASFEYDLAFARSGIQLSPLMMPLSGQIYRFPELAYQTFHGLPGMLADSLPDRFGNALIDSWLAAQGRTAVSFNAIERLCYTGERGMGALEFAPVVGPDARQTSRIQVDRLVALASEVLTQRNQLEVRFDGSGSDNAMRDILRVGTSAGGARAKAIIAWNPKTNEVRSGQLASATDFEYWILKFDGVSGNRDRELNDPKGYGVIEFAYSRMAIAAGINMNKCRLFEENGRRHFMSKRFDRLEAGEKLHMQSLCAMAHYDFNQAGVYAYEQALLVIRQLGLPMSMIEEQYRRMVFNILARNQDDHVKNIAFLMDKAGRWSLSPAFDLTYSFNPEGDWTASHQMTMNGKRDNFNLDDFKACAKTASMKRGRAEKIIDEVRTSVSQWNKFADDAGVDRLQRDQIQGALRLGKL